MNATGTAGNRQRWRFSGPSPAATNILEDGPTPSCWTWARRCRGRHYLAIDGEPVVDVSNTWLPPTTSAIVDLTAETAHPRGRGRTHRHAGPLLQGKKVEDATTFHFAPPRQLDYTVGHGRLTSHVALTRTPDGPGPGDADWPQLGLHPLLAALPLVGGDPGQRAGVQGPRPAAGRHRPGLLQWWGSCTAELMEFDKEQSIPTRRL